MKFKSLSAVLLAICLLLSGCGAQTPAGSSPQTVSPSDSHGSTVSPSASQDSGSTGSGSGAVTPSPGQDSDSTAPGSGAVAPSPGQNSGSTGSGGSTSAPSAADPSELFSDRDLAGSYDTRKSALIQLNGTSAACSSNAVRISGSTVTITDEGTYILSGTLNDGMIIVNADKKDKIQLVLNGMTIHSATCAPIYILQADKVFLTLAGGTENTLSNGGTFTPIDENNIDSVIFSKEDLTLNGSGMLTISSPAGHGIVSKDELTITGGTYTVNSSSHAMTGKDCVSIAGGTFSLTAGKDGIHAENADDAALGFVYIQDGTFTVCAAGDGISATAYLQIDGGTFDITTGGGSANAANKTSNNWGGFMGRPGGMGGNGGGNMNTTTNSNEDSTSIKALKASGNLIVNGGTFTIDSADDSVHSNASVTVSAGAFEIASGDDAFHADDTLTISGGTTNVIKSYEGLEGLHIVVSGGSMALVASDDGLNAAGGTDSSGMGGVRGPDQFRGGKGGMGGMGGSSNGSILISGGNLYVQASGDGIDANGTLTISGGITVVCGPTQGDTATLDYDVSGIITGGTFIGTGAAGMAQTFSSSEQGVIAIRAGTQAAQTTITLSDSTGKQILSCTPKLDFSVIIISTPDMVKGQSYTITVGTQSATFSAS